MTNTGRLRVVGPWTMALDQALRDAASFHNSDCFILNYKDLRSFFPHTSRVAYPCVLLKFKAHKRVNCDSEGVIIREEKLV